MPDLALLKRLVVKIVSVSMAEFLIENNDKSKWYEEQEEELEYN
jgi:hypothetical protein